MIDQSTPNKLSQYSINYQIQLPMYNKSNSLNQRRIWTDIAEDIGHVLRKQMLNNQIVSRSQKKHQTSTHLITKSLFQNPKISAVLQQTQTKKLYFMRDSSHSLRHKIQSQKYPKFENLRAIKKMYDNEGENSLQNEYSRAKILSQQKKKEAEMMKSYLHKLKVQNNIKKIHNLRQKCYKVWKLRITNSTKKNQAIPTERHYQ